ncbi:hypothetical protein ACMFMF_011838 [Clarireedia jacksonii]
MARKPENNITYRHSLCDECTVAFGQEIDHHAWTFSINTCPFCGVENTRIFPLKPSTAGIRSIIAEGGGIRGIIPLAFLKELESAIALPTGIHEHFDLAFGSSSGALVILGLFLNKWSVDECLTKFQDLSHLIFRKRILFGKRFPALKFISRILEIIFAVAADSRYSSVGINRALQGTFGTELSLFEAAAGVKIGVTATTIDDCSTCIFANYNGQEARSENCGYRMIRLENQEKEIYVWEAYFKPFRGYQDGGLGGHNNPINLALWEQDLIWKRSQKQPDIVLSLGTGYTNKTNEEAETNTKGISFFNSYCVPRLFASFFNFFVGESRWRELCNTLSPQVRDRYYRLNIEFLGSSEPTLDDTQVIPGLRQHVRWQASANHNIQNCAERLLASLFYIELDGLPRFDRSVFVCRARILCRLNPSSKGLRVLAGRLRDKGARFHLDFHHAVLAFDSDIINDIEAGKSFSKFIVFRIRSLTDSVDIKIDGIVSRQRSISNCPYKVETLIKDQSLDCAFGRRGIKKKSKIQNLESSSPRGVKRVNVMDN